MRLVFSSFGLIAISVAAVPAAVPKGASSTSTIPFETMTLQDMATARAAGTGCVWLGGKDFTRRVSIKEDRGAVKRNGRIVALRPMAGAKEMFPYTYDHWIGGGMDVLIESGGKVVGRGPEHVETMAKLILTENGRSHSWQGRLNCGS